MVDYNMHMMMNTHWDREWRWSFRETQRRLKTAMDIVVNTMENDERFYSFHTDSQVSMVDDYLEICPEKREQVIKLIKDKRLMIGPWYTLPAEFLVSGESLVRNLLIGHKIGNQLGGVMKAAYNIFSWGQISQLPQIYKQFGMDTILFYRGIDKSELETLEFWWKAPDGSQCLAVTFGKHIRLNFWKYVYKPYLHGDNPDGYDRTGEKGFLFHLSDEHSNDRNHHLLNQHQNCDFSSAKDGMEQLIDSLHKASTNELLFLQGFDLENPDPTVLELIDYINENLNFGKIVVDTLPDYIESLRNKLKESGKEKDLPILCKEMLDVEKHDQSLGPLYPGVFSARMPIKLANDDCEIRLMYWAEPSAVMATFAKVEYPKIYTDLAWKTLCQNQQHDGIGGCHVDRVTYATMERFREVNDLCDVITLDSLQAVVEEIDFSDLSTQQVGIVVFNSLLFSRSGIVQTVLDIPVQNDKNFGGMLPLDVRLKLTGPNGDEITYEILEQSEQTIYVSRKFGSNTNFPAIRFKIAFHAENVPAFGFSRYTAEKINGAHRPLDSIATEPNRMENEFISVNIDFDGTVEIYNKQTGESFTGLNYFEDEGEVGGPLIHIRPANDVLNTTRKRQAECTLLHTGPLYATYRVRHIWNLPKGVELESKRQIPNPYKFVEHGQFCRLSDTEVLTIDTQITLKKCSKFVEFKTVVNNNIKNHRLRAVFPTQINTSYILADSPFDVVQRNIDLPDSSGWFEEALKNYPSNSFVSISDEKSRGIQLIHCGIPEYEIIQSNKSIAITLLRCFEVAGGGGETYRKEPLAQCQGEHTFTYGLYVNDGKCNHAKLLKNSQEFKTPFKSAQCSAHKGSWNEKSKSLVDIHSDKIIVTAIKRAENDEDMIIRCYNPLDYTASATVKISKSIIRASKVTLEETFVEDMTILKNTININVNPHEIYTLKVKFGEIE